MRDTKSGFKMSNSLLGVLLMLALAAAYLMVQEIGSAVNGCMIVITLGVIFITYSKGLKKGALAAAAAIALLGAAALIFWRAQMHAFIFWLLWTPLNLWLVDRLRTGIAGMYAERDFYRNESERASMTDRITRARNEHAYLNDAPIYIKIANRYNLEMVVVAAVLNNAAQLHNELGEVQYNEMLEDISGAIHKTVRLEDLTYLIDNQRGTWCIAMFSHTDAIDIVTGRLRAALEKLAVKQGDGTPCQLDFTYGFAIYDKEEAPTPITLLTRAAASAK